jgi:MFS transporter, PPP family, 3-phenylpropionic acid transporter
MGRNFFLRIAFMFGFASLASWMPILNLWMDQKKISGSAIGLLSAIPWIVMLAVQPFIGMLADKYGKNLLLKISILLSSILFLIIPFAANNITAIAFLITILSIFNTPVLALLDSITLDEVEANGHTSYAFFRFWGAPGYALGALVTGNLIPKFGMDALFYTSSGFLVLTWLALVNFKPLLYTSNRKDLSFDGIGKFFSKGPILLFLTVITIVSVGQSAINFFLTIYLKEIGSTASNTGIVLGVQAISELPFYFIGSWLLTKMEPSKIVVMAIFFTALRLFLYSLNSNPHAVIFIEPLNGITWTLLWISSVEFINKKIPAKWRTTGQSMLWAAYFGAGAVIGNMFSGAVYEYAGIKNVFVINGIMISIAAILAYYFFLNDKAENDPLKLKPELWTQ